MKRIKPLYLTIFSSLLLLGCELNYVNYIEHIESPDGKYNYCLYADDIGVGDPGFSVLKVEKEIEPEKLRINWSFQNGVSKQDTEWMLSRELLSNYEESSYHTSNPKIELIDNRFLVFSRGGYMFGLYDIKLEKDTINNCCPWSEWASQNVWAKNGTEYSGKIEKNEESDYGLWVKKNIHNKIKDYIRLNK